MALAGVRTHCADCNKVMWGKRRVRCSDCADKHKKELAAKYRAANRERINDRRRATAAKQKEARDARRQKSREQSRLYRLMYPEKCKASSAKYRASQKGKDSRREQRRKRRNWRYHNDPEFRAKRLEQGKKWIATNSEYLKGYRRAYRGKNKDAIKIARILGANYSQARLILTRQEEARRGTSPPRLAPSSARPRSPS